MAAKGKVAIVGSGLIGRSWAMLFAGGGYEVCIHDIQQQQLDSALADIARQLAELEQAGRLRGTLSSTQQLQLISATSDLAHCVSHAIHVQECVPEVLEMKKQVFLQLDQLAAETTVLSSSSSAMPCSLYTETLTNRHRAIVSHPVNPPYYMPLVELVPSPWTSDDVLKRTKSLMTDIGQVPVILRKEISGFSQPRLQYVIIQECLKLVSEGVISPDDIDTLMTEGLAYHYSFIGPFEMAHLEAEGGIAETFDNFAKNYSESSSAAIPLNNNPDMAQIFSALKSRIPLDQLVQRRHWRDRNIATLSAARRQLDNTEKYTLNKIA